MWFILAWLHHYIKRESLDDNVGLTRSLFMEVPVPSQESEWSWICRAIYRFLERGCGRGSGRGLWISVPRDGYRISGYRGY